MMATTGQFGLNNRKGKKLRAFLTGGDSPALATRDLTGTMGNT